MTQTNKQTRKCNSNSFYNRTNANKQKKTVIDHTHLYTNKQTTDRDMLLENIKSTEEKNNTQTHTHR